MGVVIIRPLAWPLLRKPLPDSMLLWHGNYIASCFTHTNYFMWGGKKIVLVQPLWQKFLISFNLMGECGISHHQFHTRRTSILIYQTSVEQISLLLQNCCLLISTHTDSVLVLFRPDGRILCTLRSSEPR
jgi:hypothetical protein